MSAAQASEAPAATKSASGMLAASPAAGSTSTEWRPPAVSFLIVSAVAATRVSPGCISAGMPMRIELNPSSRPDSTLTTGAFAAAHCTSGGRATFRRQGQADDRLLAGERVAGFETAVLHPAPQP